MARSHRREFLATIIETSRHLRRFVDLKAARLGLTGAQVRVLSRLVRREGMTQAELAAAMELRPISLSTLIDKLARQGLAERRRDHSDRRINRIHLTAAGRVVADRLDDFREDVACEVLEEIDEPALAAALATLLALKMKLSATMKGEASIRAADDDRRVRSST